VEECLAEKSNIDHVLAERAKLGPFLIESTARPIINNKTAFQGSTLLPYNRSLLFILVVSESVDAIRSHINGTKRNHFYDNVDQVKEEYRCYQLTHIDVIAIRLYTTAMAYVVNRALRDYSSHGIPVPTDFLPYIYAFLNALAKLDIDAAMNEVRL
jgi:hypothetical protein